MRTALLLLALVHVKFSQRHEFVYIPTSMNWTNAQKYCRQHYTDLATVDDRAENDELMKTAGQGIYWIGLYRNTGNGVFFWSDHSSSTFKSWRPGQPDDELCCIICTGNWCDYGCEKTLPFACYIDRKRQIVRVEVKSNQNLNDPVMMNMILEKLEQILKEKGLAQYAQLSWRTQPNGNVFQKKDQQMDVPEETCNSRPLK